MAKDSTRTKRTYPFQMFAVPRERVVRIHALSGTTGKTEEVADKRAGVELRPFDHQTQHQYCSNTGKVGTMAGIVRTSRSPSF
jgi:hypothetical protein